MRPEHEFEKVCPFQIESLQLEFQNSSSENDPTNFIVSGKVKIYDYSTDSIKEGRVHLDYVFLYKGDI